MISQLMNLALHVRGTALLQVNSQDNNTNTSNGRDEVITNLIPSLPLSSVVIRDVTPPLI